MQDAARWQVGSARALGQNPDCRRGWPPRAELHRQRLWKTEPSRVDAARGGG